MAKISKNIKRLRNEKGFTQDALAEKLYITRQAVSNWENDRTQPDIEMLEKLSEVFEVSIEELIYGKKRNTALEIEKTNYNSTLVIVFSILGALLVGAGLVLIFVTFWKDMPMLSKGIMSFIPLLAGQASGVFVLLKKKEKAPWCEGGSVLWTAGIAATLTMIYNIFDLRIYWYTVLIFVCISILPVMALLKCVSPLAVYYGCAITWIVALLDEQKSYFALIAAIALIVVGCIFSSFMLKNENKSHRSLFAHWLSMFAVLIFPIFIGIGIEGGLVLPLMSIGATGICLIVLSLKDGDMAMPYKIPGLVLTSVMIFLYGAFYTGDIETDKYTVIFTAVCFLAIPAVIAYVKPKKTDKFLIAYLAVAVVSLIVYTVSLYAMPEKYDADLARDFINELRIIALVANILLMISGGREKKLLPINLGFISVAGLTVLVVAQSGLSMMGNGILLLVFGGVLLAINFKLSRAKQKTPVTENNGEVQSDE
ncbi:MAG: DUF2157 domain-containing protein [Clostridia bacterium]|nr:DUF2157 domain-containing protein [Clostridia bacterium]MBQ7296625.1 DUF2157 domain-containing protein [Clostridia bacterium]